MCKEKTKEELLEECREEIRIISSAYYERMIRLLHSKTTAGRLIDDRGRVLLPDGCKLDRDTLLRVPRRYWIEIQVLGSDGELEEKMEILDHRLRDEVGEIEVRYERLLGEPVSPRSEPAPEAARAVRGVVETVDRVADAIAPPDVEP